MNKMRYDIGFDVTFSKEKEYLKIMRDGDITEFFGDEAKELNKRFCMIENLLELGFEYKTLDFDQQIDEWYELCLAKQTGITESVTLVYYPEENEFVLTETGQRFTELKKVDQLIKFYK